MRIGVVMDSRRYDRNADQLAQIFWHLQRKQVTSHNEANELFATYRELIHEALLINDMLGQMAKKGLI